LAAANIAFRPLRDYWYVQAVAAGVLLILLVVYQNVVRRQSLHRTRRQRAAAPLKESRTG
jgi:hypothetical protein